jgi:hypothetical protein
VRSDAGSLINKTKTEMRPAWPWNTVRRILVEKYRTGEIPDS